MQAPCASLPCSSLHGTARLSSLPQNPLSLTRLPPQAARRTQCLQPCQATFHKRNDVNLLGDWGARDPTPAEVASNFSDKVIGNWDTSHLIKPPEKMSSFVGLKSKSCSPVKAGETQKLDETDIDRLRNQVPGWRLVADASGCQCLRQDWKVRGFKEGLELFARIGAVAEAEGHHPDLHLEGYSQAYAQLTTHAVGGLTENDFIIAAKVNDISMTDLLPKPKQRFWA